jgi:WD40 repeat protein
MSVLDKTTQELSKDQTTMLKAFSRALRRESHVLTQHPDLLWQQLYNRLQWEDDRTCVLLEQEQGSCSNYVKKTWLKTRMPFPESELRTRTLVGHTDRISHCAFSPDGSFLVSASQDRTLKIWDRVMGIEKATLVGHSEGVNRCSISPDGTFIVSASRDETLKIWDAFSGDLRFTLRGHKGPITDCLISPDGSFVASAGWDGAIFLWDPRTGGQIRILGVQSPSSYSPITCALDPKGRLIATAINGILYVWDVVSGQIHDEIENRYALDGGPFVFSPDGRYIAYATRHATISMWDIYTHRELYHLDGHLQDEIPNAEIGSMTYVTEPCITASAFSPDGTFFVTGSNLGYVRLWNLGNIDESCLLVKHDREISALMFSPDSLSVVSASNDNTLNVSDPKNRVVLAILEGHSSEVTHCLFSPDGANILSSSSDNTLQLWNVPKEISFLPPVKHNNLVSACVISPDGSFVASASYDGTLAVWNSSSGKQISVCKGHVGPIEDCVVSPDNRYLVSWSDDLTLRFWIPDTGITKALLREADLSGIPGQTMGKGNVKRCVISPDFKFAITISSQALIVWDLSNGSKRMRLQRMHDKGVGDDCKISPDSLFFVAVGGGDVAVWDITTGTLTSYYPGDAPIALSSDGKMVINCQDQRTLVVREVRGGRDLALLSGHSAKVRTCAFSHDGSIAASGSEDGMVIIWDVNRSKARVNIQSHESYVWRCSFTPDDRNLITIGRDHMLCVWDVNTGISLTKFPLLAEGSTFDLDKTQPIVVIGDVGGAVYLAEIVSGKEI